MLLPWVAGAGCIAALGKLVLVGFVIVVLLMALLPTPPTSTPSPTLPAVAPTLPAVSPTSAHRLPGEAPVPATAETSVPARTSTPTILDSTIENDPGVSRARLELERYQKTGNLSNIQAAQRTLEKAITHAQAMASSNLSGGTLVRPKRTIQTETLSDVSDDSEYTPFSGVSGSSNRGSLTGKHLIGGEGSSHKGGHYVGGYSGGSHAGGGRR